MQITFTCSKDQFSLIEEIDEIANRDGRSRSGMIVLLLQQAVKERNRKRKNAKEIYISDQPSN
jgi:metal-responsive CopG/Arc/MetJ family transcriptional regulator